MKQLLIFFVVFFIYVNSADIERTICADNNLKIDACYLVIRETIENKDIETTYVRGCSGGKECYSDDDVRTCVKHPFKELLLDIDKECKFNEECTSEVCTNNKCAFLATGESCDDEDDGRCGYLSECVSNNDGEYKCVELLQKDASCNGTINCGLGLACGGENICVKKYTQEAGTKTVSPDACKSGTAYSFDGENLCVSVTLKEDKCKDNLGFFTVTYTAKDKTKDDQYGGNCVFKPDGTKAPENFKGSPEWDNYVKEYIKENEKLEKDDYKYIKNTITLDKKSLVELYVFYKYKTEIDNDECIRDYYLSKDNASYYSLSMWLIFLFTMLI